MSKKRSPSSRARGKQHQRACAKPETQKLLKQLQAAWTKHNMVERGDELKKLVDLGVDDKTVRRDLIISALPEEARTAIAVGCDPEPYLRAAADQQIAVDARERAAVERIDGSPSNALADNIVWLLAAEAGRAAYCTFSPSHNAQHTSELGGCADWARLNLRVRSATTSLSLDWLNFAATETRQISCFMELSSNS